MCKNVLGGRFAFIILLRDHSWSIDILQRTPSEKDHNSQKDDLVWHLPLKKKVINCTWTFRICWLTLINGIEHSYKEIVFSFVRFQTLWMNKEISLK